MSGPSRAQDAPVTSTRPVRTARAARREDVSVPVATDISAYSAVMHTTAVTVSTIQFCFTLKDVFHSFSAIEFDHLLCYFV